MNMKKINDSLHTLRIMGIALTPH